MCKKRKIEKIKERFKVFKSADFGELRHHINDWLKKMRKKPGFTVICRKADTGATTSGSYYVISIFYNIGGNNKERSPRERFMPFKNTNFPQLTQRINSWLNKKMRKKPGFTVICRKADTGVADNEIYYVVGIFYTLV